MENLSCIPKFVKKEVADMFVGETWKLMLLDNTFVPSSATQQFITDVLTKEIPASGPYTAGGVEIEGKVSVEDNPSVGVYNYYIDAADKVIGPGATLNYRYGVLFRSSGSSKIRIIVDFMRDQIVVNGTSTIKWNTLGIIYIS